MKLSDAAVLGASRWERTCYANGAENDTGCFLQLAVRAIGGNQFHWAEESLRHWPWLQEPAEGPVGSVYLPKHIDAIWNLNDCGAPFEQILAYVRQHEPAEQPSAAQADQLEAEKCRCRQSFATYDLLLDHIANGERATGPHMSEEAAKRLEALRENEYDRRANT